LFLDFLKKYFLEDRYIGPFLVNIYIPCEYIYIYIYIWIALQNIKYIYIYIYKCICMYICIIDQIVLSAIFFTFLPSSLLMLISTG
jgi:hypothetical protein